MTLASVLIPCYNAERWIEACVRSALEQTWPHVEVLVVDDGSTDGSVERLRSFGDAIRVTARENRGGNPTRNELAQMARGDWLQFLDADDALLPDKMEQQLAVLSASPDADVIYGPLRIEHHAGDAVREEIWRPHDSQGDHDAWAYHLQWRLTQTGGALFRRDALQRVGAWNEQQPCCQDNELFHRLLCAGARFVHCDHVGAIYRRFDGGSVSTQRMDRVRAEMLRLLEAGESHLEQRGELTDRRRTAMNECRFGLARQLWPHDQELARSAIAAIGRSEANFQPAPGPHAPQLYRRLFSTLGFEMAERMAAWKRRWLG